MKFVLISLVLTPLIYLAIAFILVMLPFNREQSDKSLDFEVLHTDSLVGTIASEKYYTARDGSEIFYRFVPGKANVTVVLIHGSGAEGRYLVPLAKKLNSLLDVSVVIPDLRGHGKSALGHRGDTDYLGQLEHDLEDLKRDIAFNFPKSKIIVGGHSSGGGLVVRYGGNNLDQFDGYVLLAPYLGYKAPTVRPNSGGWVQVRKARYAGLAMLNNIGFKFFNHLPVLYFNRPAAIDDEFQVDSYSFRMNESFSPRFYVTDLKENDSHILAIVGEFDEAFYADKFESVFSENAPLAEFKIVPNAKHLDLPDANESVEIIVSWLDKKFNKALQPTSR
ncbi:MAG: alpha/beta hydrolase [Alteromonadaceae bacterium]|nr:alpha/beta hydrolase [Alteromonadaceae bacterium]